MGAAKRKVAMVTEAGSPLGIAICRALAESGFDIALQCGPTAAIELGRKEIADVAAESDVFRCNLSEIRLHDQMLEDVLARFGSLHVLVNLCQTECDLPIDLLTVDETGFDEFLDSRIRAPYFLAQRAAKKIVAQNADDGSTALINISPVVARRRHLIQDALAAAATNMATKLWATRLVEFHTPVYEIRTAPIRKAHNRTSPEADQKTGEGGFDSCDPCDVAQAVTTLATGRLRNATGTVISVDGGLSVQRL